MSYASASNNTESLLSYSSTQPTNATHPDSNDNDTVIVTSNGWPKGTVTEVWKYDAETNTRKNIYWAPAPTQSKCGGWVLTSTDQVLVSPTGTYASGYTINQEDANGCATRADTYYDRARRTHTFGKASMQNDAQGYGSSVTGWLRNTTATWASYSHIWGWYDHSITVWTANTIGWGRNNDITAWSYNGISYWYNHNITAGNYNTIGWGNANDIKAGSYNTIVWGSAIDFEAGTGSYNVAGWVNHTFNWGNYTTAFGNNHISDWWVAWFMAWQSNSIRAGNYNTLLGFSHDNIAGSWNFLWGYNHTNTSGNYNTLLWFTNINRSGSHNVALWYSHDVSWAGNTILWYNNTANTNYSVSIGRNLNNTTQDGIMIANSFQRIWFFWTTPITRQTVNNTSQLITALKAYWLIL